MTLEEAKMIIEGDKPPSISESRNAGLSFDEFAETAKARIRYSAAQDVIAAADRPAATPQVRTRRRRRSGCGCDNAPDCLCAIWMR